MGKKVILIDDSRTQLNTLKIFFQKAGFEVITAEDGVSAYPLIFNEAPDLIVSDIMMPNLNGYQLCRLVKNHFALSKIPVILLTILDHKIDRFWGKEAGAQLFISKTEDFSKIIGAAKELCELYPVTDSDKELMLAQKITAESVQYQLNSILDDSLQQSVIMNDFRFLTEFLENEKTLVENIFSLLASLLDYNCVTLFFNNIDDKDRVFVYHDVQKQSVSDDVLQHIAIELLNNSGLTTTVENENFSNVVFFNQYDEKTISSPSEFKSTFVLPIHFEDKLLGSLIFNNVHEVNYGALKFMQIIKNELFLLMRIRRLYAETKYLAVTDTLTGLYNRRHMTDYLFREFSRCRRYKTRFSIAIIDLDKFKSVNDTYGHHVGDFVLSESARLLSNIFRKTDTIFRYGGEEFIILLPETSADQAFIPLERYRKKMEAHDFAFDDLHLKMCASVGIADNSIEIKNEDELVKHADSALYKAKDSGRNRVIIYNG